MNLHDIDACAPLPPAGREPARRRLGIDPACFVVLDVVSHTVAPRDGVDTVILALARLRQQYGVDGILLLTGRVVPNAELARLRALARALQVEPHVRFVADPLPDVLRDCHAAANVLASTPWCASRASAAHEAMPYALPVLCTDADGSPSAVRDGITGYLIPPRDAALLADRLARLQRLPLLAQAMAQAMTDTGRAHLSNPDRFQKKAIP